MSNNESIKSVIQELVTPDIINSAIQTLVEDSVDIKEMVYRAIHDKLRACFEKRISEIGEKLSAETIDSMLGEMVKKRDGWGNEETYASFEQFVKQELRKYLFERWRFQRQVEIIVEEKIKQTCEEVRKEYEQEIVNESCRRLVGEAAKKNDD